MSSDLIDELSLVDWPDGAARPSFDTLRPPGLGDRALLLIRSVSVVARTGDVPGAVGDEVDRALTRAARPVSGRLPPDAEAVVFEDETEALAAYLVALADGSSARQWWWRLAVPWTGIDPVAVLSASDHPAVAVIVLERWGVLDHVFATATPQELIGLLRVIAAAHALEVSAEPSAVPLGEEAPGYVGDLERFGRPTVAAHEPSPTTGIVVHRNGSIIGSASVAAPALRTLVTEIARVAVGVRRETDGGERSGVVGVPVRTRETAIEGAVTLPSKVIDPPVAPALREGCEPMPEAMPPTFPVDRDAAPSPVERLRANGRPADDRNGWSNRTWETPVPAWRAERPRVRTELAGGLFVVNALRSLDLPDELTVVAPWDLVEAVVRSICGEFDDPLWDVMAELAGRSPGERVAVDLVATVARRRDDVASCVELDVETLAELLRVSGIVEYDTTHVDVHMALDDLRLETRRAGLDLDPGWVPELGRVIRFHYRDGLP